MTTLQEHKVWRRSTLFALLSGITCLFMWLLYEQAIQNVFSDKDITRFEEVFQKKDAELESRLKALANREQIDTHDQFQEFSRFSFLEETPFRFAIYDRNDSIIYWSSNSAPFPVSFEDSLFDQHIVKLANGWYSARKIRASGKHFIGLMIIQYQYPYNNDDLENRFHPAFDFEYNGEISLNQDAIHQVKTKDQEFAFGISHGQKKESNKYLDFLIIVLLFIAFVLAFEAVLLFLKQWRNKGRVLLYSTPFILLLLRYFSIEYQWLNFLNELDIFRPNQFGVNQYFPSLGDLLINVLVLFYGAILFRKHFKPFSFDKRRKIGWLYLLNSFVAYTLIYPFGWGIAFLFRQFIENSNINFDIEQLFSLTFYSILGLLSMGFLLYTYYVYVQFTIRWMFRYWRTKWSFAVIILSTGILFTYLWGVSSTTYWVSELWPLIIVSTCLYVTLLHQSKYNFARSVFAILICSIFTAQHISINTSIREKKNRLILAEKLATDEDPMTEIEFDQLEGALDESALLGKVFKDERNFSMSDFERKLRKKHFKQFWDKYEIDFSIFDDDSTIFGSQQEIAQRSQKNYERIIDNHSVQSQINSNVYFLPDYYDQISYLIRYPFTQNDTLQGILYAELRSKKIPEQIGFPTLLLDQGNQVIEEINDYSFARYVNGQLITHIGSYTYPTQSPYAKQKLDSSFYYNEAEYNHLIFPVGDKSSIILSLEAETWFTQITSFSYIFTFFGLMLMLTLGIRQVPSGLSFESINLTAKIQILFISLTFVTLILFGLGATTFIRNQYKEKTRHLISEKSHSVKTEVHQNFGSLEQLTLKQKDYAENLLARLSKVFVTDINIFQPDGTLLASSRPVIYINGLLSKKMNPEAYNEMRFDHSSLFIHSERIGKLDYLSGYIPLENNRGKLLGYLNLQYFAQQSELENEMSEFLVAIINIFVFLLAFGIIGSIFVSNWITRPIKMLQTGLRRVELGKRNQIIEYNGKDEIGELVQEYNQKVEELAENAEKLAQSERESAWREMAKQIAHEIKNPLTPMKLSIQHLKRTIDPNDPDAHSKMKKIADSLIEQINTLSSIANEFSNFAKMPKAQSKTIDLAATIQNSIQLFQDHNNTKIKFYNEVGDASQIYADKELIIRVFNNLIKNAIQAIPENQEGEVIIKIEHFSEEQLQISISDNGIGIPKTQQKNIFVPNFTTKSNGTGLGLAMVKNIVESANGKVGFSSQEGRGATFYIYFNKQV